MLALYEEKMEGIKEEKSGRSGERGCGNILWGDHLEVVLRFW